MNLNVVVIGTGYVGLVTGVCLSDLGHNVICVDTNIDKINKLQLGVSTIYEPGLNELLKKNISTGRISFTNNLELAIQNANIVFIAVGTPQAIDGTVDLQYVIEAANQIGLLCVNDILIVNKSTVPVGTRIEVKQIISSLISQRKINVNIDVASNPEFLKEGSAISDFVRPDRIVLGVESEFAKNILFQLYKPLIDTNDSICLIMDCCSAELVKYASNAMLATRISFINEIANLCEVVGANINQVVAGVGSDSRIGNSFIRPGIGYGGSCFPKDVSGLIRTAKQAKKSMKILEAVSEVNLNQKRLLFSKVYNHFSQNIAGKRFAIWGLSFKPNTDDMREASSIDIIERLLEYGAIVSVYDPVSMDEAYSYFGKSVIYGSDKYSILKDSAALLLVTEWEEFKNPDWSLVYENLMMRVIFDGRNHYNKAELEKLGFIYYGIGL